MIAFIDDHRQAYGVEPICRVLPIAPSTYHAHAATRADPSRLPERVRRDADLKVEIRRVFDENFRVCARSGGNCGGKASPSRAVRWPG
jgi:putative transposase